VRGDCGHVDDDGAASGPLRLTQKNQAKS
jgi:hypothetical protein